RTTLAPVTSDLVGGLDRGRRRRVGGRHRSQGLVTPSLSATDPTLVVEWRLTNANTSSYTPAHGGTEVSTNRGGRDRATRDRATGEHATGDQAVRDRGDAALDGDGAALARARAGRARGAPGAARAAGRGGGVDPSPAPGMGRVPPGPQRADPSAGVNRQVAA